MHKHTANPFPLACSVAFGAYTSCGFLLTFSLSIHSFLKQNMVLISPVNSTCIQLCSLQLCTKRGLHACTLHTLTAPLSEHPSFFTSICKTKYREGISYCMKVSVYMCLCVLWCVFIHKHTETYTCIWLGPGVEEDAGKLGGTLNHIPKESERNRVVSPSASCDM